MTYLTQSLLERISVMARTKVGQKAKIQLQNQTSDIPHVSQNGQVTV